ncbi:Zn(2)-C6 fungal-type domain-containing protein [Pseudozyma hubeiensis]|nr:Zn(2)-C6 fungal-type domain-containing protein [Pseudozyma hubeiensis]
MADTAAEASSAANGKRKLYVACNACRFRKVKCDRENRFEQGYAACTNCDSASMECVLTVNPPKKRMGKRMRMLQEQQDQQQQQHYEAHDPARTTSSSSRSSSSQGVKDYPNATTSRPPQASPSSSVDRSLDMSPGFSSLLEAVSQEQAAASRNTSASLTASSGGNADRSAVTGLTPFVEDAQPSGSIIQNGMFAAFGSGSADALRFSNGHLQVTENHGTTHSVADETAPSAGSGTPATTGITPNSLTATSDQSSPEVIASNAAFFSSAVMDTSSSRDSRLKARNPFDKLPLRNGANQVGFVGGLLGIASLDKNMLDVCVKSYFDSMGQCIGFIRPEWFWPRYNAFFYRYSGFVLGDEADSNEQPLSELLLIAVACRGAGASQFANRFELQTDLHQHYCRLIKDRERLVRDGFDALESVILMVEHADGIPKPLPDAMSVQGVFDVDVVSHEGMIRLMKKLELQLLKPFGAPLEGRDAIRQRILFWTIYVYDAIRSEAGRTLPLIRQDDVSLPRTLPTVVGDPTRLIFRDHFVDLANVCRDVSYKIQSPRAQSSGIDPRDVIAILDELKAWHDKLGPLFSWDWNDMLHITGPSDPEDQTRRTFLIFLFLGQWLTLEYAVGEIGFAADCNPALKEEVIRRLEREVDTTLDRQVLVCDHGTLFGIIRLHPGMMQSWTTTWASWCITKMQINIAKENQGRLASAKADQAFQRHQAAVLCFINAAASCDTAPHTPTTVQDLMNALRKVTEARRLAKLTFDSV